MLRKRKICQRSEGGAFKMPAMPPWPKERITEALPLEHTGLDYFGPLYVKYYNQTP